MAADSVNIDPSVLNRVERESLRILFAGELGLPEMPVAALWLVSKETMQMVAKRTSYRRTCDCEVCIALQKLGAHE